MIKKLTVYSILGVTMLCACNEQQLASSNSENKKSQITKTVQTEVKLKDRLPATCYVTDSENLSFCLPGDTLIYKYNDKKENQNDPLDVIGGFCAQEKNIILTSKGLSCTFRENRSYTAAPVNQRAIIESNKAVAKEYLAAVAKLPGIKEVTPGISIIKLENGSQKAPVIDNNSIVNIESKLLTLDLKVHSYMLNDTLTIASLGPKNPFSAILPNLKEGDIVRAYIDFDSFPGIWKVADSLTGLPYIWEVKILSVDNSGSNTLESSSSTSSK